MLSTDMLRFESFSVAARTVISVSRTHALPGVLRSHQVLLSPMPFVVKAVGEPHALDWSF